MVYIGCGLGPRDAVSSIIDRTIAWIEHDRIHKGSTSIPPPAPPISQDMLKNSPRSPSYTTLPGNAPSSTPSQAGGEHINGSGSANHSLSTPRNALYPEPPTSHDSGAYHQHQQPTTNYYSDSTSHSPASVSYDPTNGQYLYAPQAQAHVHSHAHTQGRIQGHPAHHARTDHHNHPLNTFSTPTSQMAESSQPPPSPADMLWRLQTTPHGNPGANGAHTTWQDWTAAVVDNQDRYSANALMSLGSSGANGPRTTHSGGGGGLNDTIVSNDLGIPVSVGLNGVNGANTVATTTSNMQWPLLLFSDGAGVGGP